MTMKLIAAGILAVLCSAVAFGDDDPKPPPSRDDPNYGVTYSTKLDFDSTLIEGKMKAPSGFFLQGRNRQSLSNMVKLRSDFKQELRNSRSAVKALVR